MKQVLFVCMSHNLTPDQIAGLTATYGEIAIVTIASVNPELAKLCASIPATATTAEVRDIAKRVVEEAVKANATHFMCAGEPTLMINANNLAYRDLKIGGMLGPMRCIQSTTERQNVESADPNDPNKVIKTQVFKHVQWRNLF